MGLVMLLLLRSGVPVEDAIVFVCVWVCSTWKIVVVMSVIDLLERQETRDGGGYMQWATRRRNLPAVPQDSAIVDQMLIPSCPALSFCALMASRRRD